MAERIKYPLRPLLAAAGVGYDEAQRRIGCSGTRWAEANHDGISWLTADRWAVRLGLHPFAAWPEMLDDALAAETSLCAECGGSFEATAWGREQIYCGSRCNWRAHARRRRVRRSAEHRTGREVA